MLLGATAALATAGCESGWDLEGHVITDAVADKSGSLHVYVVDEPTIDIAAVQMASPSIFYGPLATTQPIPEAGYEFGVHHFGCHRGAVAIVAWAPSAPEADRLAPPFAPAPVTTSRSPMSATPTAERRFTRTTSSSP